MKSLAMKFSVRVLGVLCVLGGGSFCFALDREAFSITNYDLNLQIDPAQHRLGVRGKITLRNDTSTPQRNAALQISSSLDWRSIKSGDKPLQFLTQPYTSDIDHTGALAEAVVTLPRAVEPHATLELEIGYEGVILPDATRLTRIGTPDDAALSSDWDQISPGFTALRGAGYVAWYPIATDVANLSEGDSLFEVLARWKAREAGSKMYALVTLTWDEEFKPPEILMNGMRCSTGHESSSATAECPPQTLRDAPTLVIADYQLLERPAIDVRYLRGHDAAAAAFADTAQKAAPLISDWFGTEREKAKVADLPNPDTAPYESGALLLSPLSDQSSTQAGLAAAHQLTHASFLSFRPWIEEGLAHFAQALYLEQQKGRPAAIDYMGLHRSALTTLEERTVAPRSDDATTHSLVNTINEELYRSKAMCVWWMLRDMIDDSALKKALAAYRPEDDKDPTYMPRLIAAQTQRELSWFFDDWVYHDRGLPDFTVESAFSRKTANDTFLLTVTLENLGTAGAEVPVVVKFPGGELMKRIEVRAKSKGTFRLETPTAPEQIIVNDGSVPESDVTNNTFKIPETTR